MLANNFGEDFKKNFMNRAGKGGILSKKLAEAIIAKAADMIDNEVTCQHHRGQPLVAFDKSSQYFGCVQCLYDGEY